MDKEEFEKLVEEALADLPSKFKKYLQNIAVIVEEYPSKETRTRTGTPSYATLLGLYHGVPFKHRGPYYGNNPPDVIVLYQKPIENICATEEEVKEKVKSVLLHEIGHYFGLSEKELRKIEK
jgi:predicted Zn-dependent protease with MMP-like domain